METWQTKQLEILMFQKELDVQILRVAFPPTNLHSIHLTNGWIIFCATLFVLTFWLDFLEAWHSKTKRMPPTKNSYRKEHDFEQRI